MGQLKMSRAGNIEMKKRSGAAVLLYVLEPVDTVMELTAPLLFNPFVS